MRHLSIFCEKPGLTSKSKLFAATMRINSIRCKPSGVIEKGWCDNKSDVVAWLVLRIVELVSLGIKQ